MYKTIRTDKCIYIKTTRTLGRGEGKNMYKSFLKRGDIRSELALFFFSAGFSFYLRCASTWPSSAFSCQLMLLWTKCLRPSYPWVNKYSRYQFHGLECWNTHTQKHVRSDCRHLKICVIKDVSINLWNMTDAHQTTPELYYKCREMKRKLSYLYGIEVHVLFPRPTLMKREH